MTTTQTKDSRESPSASDETRSAGLRLHFERATALLDQMETLRADIAEWRRQARGDGLDPRALLKLAREELRDAEQRRKAAEQAELEEMYRQGLGLPLFDWRKQA
jgi:uncharacterized protein (UPF0335 family)